MPLSPAPVLPGTSPLPPPGQQPPNRRAQRAAVVVAGVALVALLAVGQILLPRIVFLAPGLQAQGQASRPDQSGAAFQGFQFPWNRTNTGGGYDQPASLTNLQMQANVFHMNAVIIPVVADVPDSLGSGISWNATDGGNQHILPDDQYKHAVTDALKAGLVPILELQLRTLDEFASQGNDSGSMAGYAWAGSPSNAQIGSSGNKPPSAVGDLEKQFFDNYTAFAAHYAQMAQSYHLPYFIIGDGLTSVSYDTQWSSAKGDPAGHDRTKVGDGTCPADAGRRDCSWRHVVNSIRNNAYVRLTTNDSAQGGGFQGKLIYAASWQGASAGWSTASEFDHITWWDAVDYIGVDANFPLTKNQGAPSIDTLSSAWHGKGNSLAGQGDIYTKLEKITDTYHRPIVFTSVEYDSAFGASSGQVQVAAEDDSEQLRDMQALMTTFSGTPWWSGVFWYADYPVAHDKQPSWDVLGNWAGDTFDTSKAAGKWLADYYKASPIQCKCGP